MRPQPAQVFAEILPALAGARGPGLRRRAVRAGFRGVVELPIVLARPRGVVVELPLFVLLNKVSITLPRRARLFHQTTAQSGAGFRCWFRLGIPRTGGAAASSRIVPGILWGQAQAESAEWPGPETRASS